MYVCHSITGRVYISDPTQYSISYRQCPPGQFDPPFNPTFQCVSCFPGLFSAAAGLQACTSCPPGFIGILAGLSACSACQAGTMWLDRSNCQACPPGSVQPANASTACVPCDVGKYNPLFGQTSCLTVPPGSSTTTAGATASSVCIPGQFSPAVSASTCAVCGLNTFSPLAGSTLCQACPAFSSSIAGQAACDCMIGYYIPSPTANFSCVSCPSGALCTTSSATRISTVLASQPGFWRVPGLEVAFMPCPFGPAACPSSFNGSCAVGYTGVLCGTCALGFHNSGQTCTECVGTTKYAIVIVTVVAGLALAFFYWISIKLDTTKLVNGAKVAVSCTFQILFL